MDIVYNKKACPFQIQVTVLMMRMMMMMKLLMTLRKNYPMMLRL